MPEVTCDGPYKGKRLSPKELVAVLTLHEKWVKEEPDGRPANLCEANLERVDLERVYLGGADLRKATLSFATLQEASLMGADLRQANLWEADLRQANLTLAKLHGADLVGTHLEGAIFTYVNLTAARSNRARRHTRAFWGVSMGFPRCGSTRDSKVV